MNIDIVKNKIEENMNAKVKITVNGLRNKCSTFYGTISAIYPFIFTVNVDGENKSFSYADVITGEVEVKYV